jgi:CRP-like cAMP-binding protein
MNSLSPSDFEQIRFFDCLEGRELAYVQRLLKVHSFEAGHIIFEEGDPGDRLYFILSGTVRIEKTSREGKSRVIKILRRRSMFGDMAIFDNSCRSATAVAESDVILASLHRDQFDEIMEARPRAGVKIIRALVRVMSLRLRMSDAELVDAWAFTEDTGL